MLPTPSTSHVSFSNVYEPSEDSFLLLDALSKDSEVKFLKERFANGPNDSCPLVLEVGTGSGVVLSFVAANARTLLGRRDALFVGTDLNSFACKATSQTTEKHVSSNMSTSGVMLDAINADLVSPIREDMVDILIFNPPYVPSEGLPAVPALQHMSKQELFERDSHLLALATDGGEDGMEITNVLLDQLPTILSRPRGVAYVLLCAQNMPDLVKQRLKGWCSDWAVETIHTSGKQGGWERLQILRIARTV